MPKVSLSQFFPPDCQIRAEWVVSRAPIVPDGAVLSLVQKAGTPDCNEIARLSVGHVDLAGEKLLVLGKRSRERIALTLPKNAKDALTSWLKTAISKGSTSRAQSPLPTRRNARASLLRARLRSLLTARWCFEGSPRARTPTVRVLRSILWFLGKRGALYSSPSYPT